MSPTRNMTDRRIRAPTDLDGLSFRENGLLPVVTQDADTGLVLMVAFASREALVRSLETGEMHYWSRSRQELWHKGATSGNYQDLLSLHGDCDGDSLLARVRPRGPSCHTGEATCFGDLQSKGPRGGAEDGPRGPSLEDHPPGGESTLPALWNLLVRRQQERPPDSYTVRLLDDENLRLKKLGEETAELILAVARGERKRIVEEGADLVYHLLTTLLGAGVAFDDLLRELEARKG
jgi:phosphoribosyl-ATP pyrophosphohydrolase/phosphoribosyl-AMP cyclohydrolase